MEVLGLRTPCPAGDVTEPPAAPCPGGVFWALREEGPTLRPAGFHSRLTLVSKYLSSAAIKSVARSL